MRFRTVVPQHPIATGESFQVQYVLDNADGISGFSPPRFEGFRVVAGPHVYSDSKSSFPKNLVFTLAALKEGRFKIPGATCFANGKLIKSNDAYVKVSAPDQSSESPYFLRVGEDPFKKINENLFLKLVLNKQSCFVGEPLVATFKLYSRLQSRSNVIKNPGFYGFSVYDMINVNDQLQSEENLNGRWFQVHTIRKVQLYPLQAGMFTIDPMEMANEVEFTRSLVNKKTEQEVTEIMYGNAETKKEQDADAEVFKVNVKTEPVNVKVRPFPDRNRADTFAGAVGNFSMDAFLEKDSVTKNEENTLTIDVSGSGNFQRVDAPNIKWPANFEAFDPIVTDTLNKQSVPLTGKRSFKFIFLNNQPGWHTIPAVSFSFFDLKTRTYKTVSTKPLTVFTSTKINERKTASKVPRVAEKSKRKGTLFLVVSAVLVLFVGLFIWLRRRFSPKSERHTNSPDGENPSIDIATILAPARQALGQDENFFYQHLNQAIWNYLVLRLQLSASEMNKLQLSRVLALRKVDPVLIDRLLQVLYQSEAHIYTNAEMIFDKNVQFKETETILAELEKSIR